MYTNQSTNEIIYFLFVVINSLFIKNSFFLCICIIYKKNIYPYPSHNRNLRSGPAYVRAIVKKITTTG